MIADPLDCSVSLTPEIAFANPPNIAYNSGGTATSIIVATDYEKVFNHGNKVDCPLVSCQMFDTGCSTTTVVSAQSDVVLGSTPTFGLTASETNPLGYTLNLCYKCTVQPTGSLPVETFEKEITVIADPLDCSSSLTQDTSFANPSKIPYNSGGTATSIVVATDYENIFKHLQKKDCALISSEMFDSDCSSTTIVSG